MSPVTRYPLPVPCYNLPDTVRVRVILLLSRQLLDKLWSQVSSLSPPGTCLHFLSRIGFSIPTARRFSRSRVFRESTCAQEKVPTNFREYSLGGTVKVCDKGLVPWHLLLHRIYEYVYVPYMTVYIYHTSHPPAVVFQARLLDNQEGANTERYVCLQKALGEVFPTPSFLAPALRTAVPTAVETPSMENRPRWGVIYRTQYTGKTQAKTSLRRISALIFLTTGKGGANKSTDQPIKQSLPPMCLQTDSSISTRPFETHQARSVMTKPPWLGETRPGNSAHGRCT